MKRKNSDSNQLVSSTLKSMGITLEHDKDGDLFFRYQMKYIYVFSSDNEQFINLLFNNFTNVDKKDLLNALRICNKINRETKLMKMFLNSSQNCVSASCEFFYTDGKSLEDNLRKSLKLLGLARTHFKKTARSLDA